MSIDYTDQGIDPESGLTLRERAAVDHYMISLNKTKAYHAAGYAASNYASARVDASTFFDRPYIRSYLDQRLRQRADRLNVSSDRVLLECCVIAFSKLSDFVINPETGVLSVRPGCPQEAMGAVRSVKTTKVTKIKVTTRGSDTTTETTHTWTGEITLWDKPRGVELLCKHLGLVSAGLPPLEVLFNRLPPNIADIMRRLISTPPHERPPLKGEPQAIPIANAAS